MSAGPEGTIAFKKEVPRSPSEAIKAYTLSFKAPAIKSATPAIASFTALNVSCKLA